MEWRRGFAAARVYHAENRHLLVPQSYIDAEGIRLGAWINGQRTLHAQKRLPAGRAAALESLDMVWSPSEELWQSVYAAACAYHASHGHLAVPINTVVGGVKLGQALHNYRARGLRDDRAEALAALDPWWNPPWRNTWQRHYYAARDLVREHGRARIPRTYITPDGIHLGEWLHTIQTNRWDDLDPRQQALLSELGIVRGRDSPHHQAREHGYAAVAAFVEREGHLTPPTGYTTADGYRS